MIDRIAPPRDPFEGRGARRRELRLRIEGAIAIALALAACGLTAAMWVRTLAPLAGFQLG
ncbi:MAG TPA: hypothetical protein VKB00_06265 [Candidatus Limnocylindrales bacterium]|jgi:hypothetical protein|nr:hypothetical protein [Candidatus Limnocylindrales bacterium]